MSERERRRRRCLVLIVGGILVALLVGASGAISKSAPPAPRLTDPQKSPVISAALAGRMGRVDESETHKVWVFFTDKGIFTDEGYRQALRSAEAALTDRARARRMRARGPDNLVDFRDLPVFEEYVARVLSLDVKQRATTRWLNGISLEAASSAIREIASLPFVREVRLIAPSAPVRTSVSKVRRGALYPDMPFPLDYGPSFGQLNQINVPAAHDMGHNASDVLICMLDTGYERTHQSLQDLNVVAEWDFINDDPNTAYDPTQDDPMQPWHGTITLSAIGGFYEGQLIGAAYGADFALAKTELVTDEIPIEEDWWTEGSEWADSLGAEIISSSLGYTEWYTYEWMNGDSCVTTIAADIAAYNGIVVSTAMGNEGNWVGSLIAPSDADSILACGAVNSFGELAGFSSIGPTYDGRTKPEVVAQGVNTYAADPFDDDGYLEVDGTSLSTPLVGGLAAIVRGANPSWTVMETRESIITTADNASNPDNYYGWGIPDAVEALLYAQAPSVDVEVVPDATVVPRGGTLGYTATLRNTTPAQIMFYARTLVTLPNGNPYPGNPVLGPLPVTLGPHQILEHHVGHAIPPSAPLGVYEYAMQIGTPPNNLIDEDAFAFEVVEE